MHLLIIISGCVSTTVIKTVPSNSKVFVNSEYKGTTPFTYSDNKISGSETNIKIEKEGYESFSFILKKNEQVHGGAVMAGIIFGLWPFLWIMEYNPERSFELKPLNVNNLSKDSSFRNTQSNIISDPSNDKYDNIRLLKKLQDDQIIDQEEFEKAKVLILNDKIIRCNDILFLKKLQDDEIISQEEFLKTKKLILSDDFIVSVKNPDELYKLKKLFDETLLTKEEYLNQRNKILKLSFLKGDKVKFLINRKEYIGEITKIENNYATVKYIYKYPLEDAIKYIDIKMDELIEANKK
jgi:uncharacterized protein YqgQ